MSKKAFTNVDMDKLDLDSEWLADQNLSEYDGQWVAVADERIVAGNESLELVMRKVEELDLGRIPLYVRVSLDTLY
jgi:hypothetical protein